MKLLILSMFLVFLSCEVPSSEKNSKKAPPVSSNDKFFFSEAEQLATDFVFTEGPAPDKNGNVYFTDIPESKLYIWTTDNQLELRKEQSGGANGLFFDVVGNLYACEGYEGAISVTSTTGDYTRIASTYKDKRFNQPNDVWVHPNGNVYFTDPYYGSDEGSIPQDGMHVYVILKDENTVLRVADDYVKPNGLIGTPDGKKLYVTDQAANKTFRYSIEADGRISNKSLFIDAGGDGMTIDKQGNIYLTTNGKMAIEIFSPEGDLLQSISVPEQPSNVSFGGENRDDLYITARTSLYRVKTNQKGAY